MKSQDVLNIVLIPKPNGQAKGYIVGGDISFLDAFKTTWLVAKTEQLEEELIEAYKYRLYIPDKLIAGRLKW